MSRGKLIEKEEEKKGGRISDDAHRKKEREKEQWNEGTEWNDAVVEIKKK